MTGAKMTGRLHQQQSHPSRRNTATCKGFDNGDRRARPAKAGPSTGGRLFWPPSPSIERQHRARDLAGFHRAEGFVDVAEMAALGDHRIEVEPALAIEIEV